MACSAFLLIEKTIFLSSFDPEKAAHFTSTARCNGLYLRLCQKSLSHLRQRGFYPKQLRIQPLEPISELLDASNGISDLSTCKMKHSRTQTWGGKNQWHLTNCFLASKPLHDAFMYFVLLFSSYVTLQLMPVLWLVCYCFWEGYRNKLCCIRLHKCGIKSLWWPIIKSQMCREAFLTFCQRAGESLQRTGLLWMASPVVSLRSRSSVPK